MIYIKKLDGPVYIFGVEYKLNIFQLLQIIHLTSFSEVFDIAQTFL